MAYQINLTGKEIDERLQNIGTDKDVAAADGSLYARISKNADDVDELRDTVGHIDSAQNATDKTVAQHTADISTLQTALKKKANLVLGKVSVNELPVATSLGNPNNGTIPSTFAVSKAINDKIVGLLNWQGVKDTTDEIKDIALAKKGDVWHSNEDGSEWVCTEDIFTADHSVWEELGTPIDLSGYYTKNEVDKKVKPLADSIGTDRDAASANSSVYARIKKNQTDIADIGSRQTNIEEVVSVERSDVFFSLPHLLLNFRNYNPSVVYVTLYRWTGKRYHTFEIQRDTGGTFLEVAESYKITLENYGNDGLSYQLAITYADGTKELLVEALKNAFGGRISHGRRKKRRWRLQAFLSGRPITAPFDFRVSVDHSGVVSLTKEGMMRSVPKAKEVVYDGFFSSTKWIKCKKGEVINCNYNASEKRFPQPGDFIESNRRGIVVASEYNSDGSYRILWTVGRTLYEIGIGGEVIEPSFVFYCTSPAKKLCDDIYDYASKMSSGTLRDLYISAGAKYNEATGFYELNGLTDITEEQMRVIYEKTWGWWIGLPNLNGFGDSSARTNIPCPDYKIISYASNISIHSIFSASGNDDNLEVVNLRALYTPTGFDEIKIVDFNWAFQACKKIREVQGIINVEQARYDLNIGGNIETINIKGLKVNIRFYNNQRLSKESVLYMINNSAATSAITISLNKAVYDVMKDDADIIAALAEKTNITLIQNT